MKKIVFVSLILFFVVGCTKEVTPDGKTTYRADPCSLAKIEQGVEGGLGILNILSVFWPALLPVAAAGAGVYGTYRKVKPKLLESQTKANLYHTSTHALVTAIEDFKKNNPEAWSKLKEEIKMGPQVESVIRALRGLPPIE